MSNTIAHSCGCILSSNPDDADFTCYCIKHKPAHLIPAAGAIVGRPLYDDAVAKIAVAATELSQIQRNIADNSVEYQKIVRNCHEMNAVYKSMISKRDVVEKQLAELEQATRTIKNAEADSIRAETVRAQTELTKLETTRDNLKREIILLTEQRDALKVAAPIRAFSGSRIVSPVQSVPVVMQQTPTSPPAVVSPNSSTFDLPQNFFNAAAEQQPTGVLQHTVHGGNGFKMVLTAHEAVSPGELYSRTEQELYDSRIPLALTETDSYIGSAVPDGNPTSTHMDASINPNIDKGFTNFVGLNRPTEKHVENAQMVADAIESNLIQPPNVLNAHRVEQLTANAQLVKDAIESGLIQPPIVLDAVHRVSSPPTSSGMDAVKAHLLNSETELHQHTFAPNTAVEPTDEQKAAASKIFGTQ